MGKKTNRSTGSAAKRTRRNAGGRGFEGSGRSVSNTAMELTVAPWNGVDGPSLACAAAALQLMPENIHHLGRLQRLAAIGASLPERPEARRLSPSRLRSLLKHPAVSGAAVRANEDPYDEIYVVDVPFHGGPRRVMQGLTSQSGRTLNLLLPAVLHERGGQVPEQYREQVETVADLVLGLSESVCEAAGLQRGVVPPEHRVSEVTVPGQGRLEELCAALTFTNTDLAEVSETALAVVQSLSTQAGTADWRPAEMGYDPLIVRPLLRGASRLIIANPGELAAALRHRILSLAAQHGCQSEVAKVFRATAFMEADRLMRLCGARARTDVLSYDSAPLSRRRYSIADDKIIDLVLVADDLEEYQFDQPFGTWKAAGLEDVVSSWLKQTEDETDDLNTLRLVIIAGLGRAAHFGLTGESDGPLLLLMRLDELTVIAELDGTDPLFLWNFAVADRQLQQDTRVLAFNTLDLYALYRNHEYSFCLGDDRPPNMIAVESDMGLSLRIEAMKRLDVHQVPSARRAVFVDVVAEYGSDIAPIYVSLGHEEAGDLLVEADGTHVWVLYDDPGDHSAGDMFEIVGKAAAYWLWQIDTRLPGLLSSVSVRGRLVVQMSMDDPAAWSGFRNGAEPADPSPSWLRIRPRRGRLELQLLADGASHLLAGHNEPDRQLLAALLAALLDAAGHEKTIITDLVEETAPLGPKRMMTFASATDDLDLRPSDMRARYVQPAQTARILDELGEWLSANGLAHGAIPDEERTQTLGKAVGHYFQLLTDAVAQLSPDGLLEQLIARDEALIYGAAVTRRTVVPRIACFGEAGAKTQELIKARQRALTTAITSRFLIEYVTAQPPAGHEVLTVERYDYLLALADELTNRGMLSDAIHHGFSDAHLSLLPSGRLGVSRGGTYETGTDAFLEARIADLRKLAVGPVSNIASDASSGPDKHVEDAMRAEFGFTFEQLGLGIGELIEYADQRNATEPCTAPRAQVRAHLMAALGWPEQIVEDFLNALTLEPREQFLSVGPDSYPWRFNRNYSYLRRPLILRNDIAGDPVLLWGIRRLWDTGNYLIDLVYSGRLRAKSAQMRRVGGTVRQDHNKDFERRVAQEFASGGCNITAYSIANLNGRKLESASGDDLGDIDALGLNTRHHLIVVGEAKDFEVARTPAEMSHEAEALIYGEKSAVFKTARRAQWVREHLADVLAHFKIEGPTQRWRVQEVIVTSRDLLSPRVSSTSVPVITIGQAQAWAAETARRGR